MAPIKQISIIIVSWNARRHLRDCLKSLGDPWNPIVHEVIVVDNNSTDGASEMVAEEFPEVKLIKCENNFGFARANNIGIQHASGSYLALVNSDVIVHPDCLEKLVDVMQTFGDVGLVGPTLFGVDGATQQTYRNAPSLWNAICRSLALDTALARWPFFSGRAIRRTITEGIAEVDVLSGCFWLARQTAIKNIGGLDERFFFYAEDVDWCKRFWDGGWKVVFVQDATSTHCGGASSAKEELRYSIEIVRANLTYWRKHFGWPGQVVFYLLSILHHSLRLLLRQTKALTRRGANDDTLSKLNRSTACLRWLLTGRTASEVNS